MEWVQLSCSYPTKYPIRESYTALFYKGSVYIFGGKDRNNAIRNDLLILNSSYYLFTSENNQNFRRIIDPSPSEGSTEARYTFKPLF